MPSGVPGGVGYNEDMVPPHYVARRIRSMTRDVRGTVNWGGRDIPQTVPLRYRWNKAGARPPRSRYRGGTRERHERCNLAPFLRYEIR